MVFLHILGAMETSLRDKKLLVLYISGLPIFCHVSYQKYHIIFFTTTYTFADVLQNRCSLKNCKAQKKIPEPEYLFNKVTGVYAATLLKKRLRHRCFLMNSARYLRRLFRENKDLFWMDSIRLGLMFKQGFPRDLFLAHYSLWSISMTYLMAWPQIQNYLRMTLLCSSLFKI